MADREKDIRKFRRAAEQRLAAASFLLEHGFHLDAIYLAGYAVECSLKYLILKRTPRDRFRVMLNRLTGVGAKGHDFAYLRHILRSKSVNAPLPTQGELATMFREVASWSTSLRCEVAMVDYEEARRIVDAARGIQAWTDRS